MASGAIARMSLVLYQTDFKLLDGQGPEVIDLKNGKTTTTIGRGSQTIRVDAAIFARKNGADIISRKHAEIVRTSDGAFRITDLGALNGTFVNLVRVNTQVLRDGDIVQFGGLTSLQNGPDGFCVKYIFLGHVKQEPSREHSKDSTVTVVKKENEDASKKKKVKQGVKQSAPDACEVFDLSESTGHEKKRVRIDARTAMSSNEKNVLRNNSNENNVLRNNQSKKNNGIGSIDSSVVTLSSKSSRQKIQLDNLLVEYEEMRKELLGLKKTNLELQFNVTTATNAVVAAATAAATAESQSTQKISLTSEISKQSTARVRTPGNGSTCSKENDVTGDFLLVQTLREGSLSVLKENSLRKEDSSRKEDSLKAKAECIPNTTSSKSSSGCSIDVSSLRSTLSCAICSLPLLDAVVVPCSHGVRTHKTPVQYSHFLQYEMTIAS